MEAPSELLGLGRTETRKSEILDSYLSDRVLCGKSLICRHKQPTTIGWHGFCSTKVHGLRVPGPDTLVVPQNSEQKMMDTIDTPPVDGGRNDKSKKAKVENGFYNVVDEQNVFGTKGLSISNPATGKQLAVIPYAKRAVLNRAISDARNAFSGWGAVPFERRKAILASLLNKIGEHADELSALLAAEQGGPLVQARWEIDLLTKGVGPYLRQMEVSKKEQNGQSMQHITKRYAPIYGGTVSLWNLPVILSFGKVFPALLTGDTVVLRPSPFNPLTVLRISELIRELLPAGVFSVVIGGHELLPWMKSRSGIDLIAFTRSENIGRRVLDSDAGSLEPLTVLLGGDVAETVANAKPEKNAVFGSIALLPITWEPGRYGLARTLFEILSFERTGIRAQVLVWSLARKASYSFPKSECK
jgi:delta 1-pyrroline-5-carboxylate dehydrogenase